METWIIPGGVASPKQLEGGTNHQIHKTTMGCGREMFLFLGSAKRYFMHFRRVL